MIKSRPSASLATASQADEDRDNDHDDDQPGPGSVPIISSMSNVCPRRAFRAVEPDLFTAADA
jgi:hypothetical protein